MAQAEVVDFFVEAGTSRAETLSAAGVFSSDQLKQSFAQPFFPGDVVAERMRSRVDHLTHLASLSSAVDKVKAIRVKEKNLSTATGCVHLIEGIDFTLTGLSRDFAIDNKVVKDLEEELENIKHACELQGLFFILEDLNREIVDFYLKELAKFKKRFEARETDLEIKLCRLIDQFIESAWLSLFYKELRELQKNGDPYFYANAQKYLSYLETLGFNVDFQRKQLGLVLDGDEVEVQSSHTEVALQLLSRVRESLALLSETKT